MKGPSPGPSTETTEFKLWNDFVSFVMKEKRFLAFHLEHVRPLKLPPGQLKIGVEDRHHLTYLQDQDNLTALKEYARRFFSGEVSVMISPLSGKSGGGGKVANPNSPTVDAKSGMVEEALKIFGGSIRDIKENH